MTDPHAQTIRTTQHLISVQHAPIRYRSETSKKGE